MPTNYNKYECACNSGFYGDGFVCVPEINCVNVPSLCDINGRCVSTKSGYQCICNAGKILEYENVIQGILNHSYRNENLRLYW